MKTLLVNQKQISFFVLMPLLTLALLGCNDDHEVKPKASHIEIKSMTPASPATLKYHRTGGVDYVRIDFNYSVIEPEGVRIWFKPFSTVADKFHFSYSPSPIYTGTGTGSAKFAAECEEENLLIDKLVVKIYDPKTQGSAMDTVDVNYTFKE